MNTLGLVICLIGISIHVIIKAKEKADAIKEDDKRSTTSRSRNTSFYENSIECEENSNNNDNNDEDDDETHLNSGESNFILKNLIKNENKRLMLKSNEHQIQPLLMDHQRD